MAHKHSSGRLTVDVVEVRIKGDREHDLHCTLKLAGKQKKTRTIRRTRHAEFNERFHFDVNMNSLGTILIHVATTGFLTIGNGTRLGSVDIPLDSEILTQTESQERSFKLQSKTGDIGTVRVKMQLVKGAKASRTKTKRKKGKPKVIELVAARNLVGLKDFLLEATADEINAQDPTDNENTALHIACLKWHEFIGDTTLDSTAIQNLESILTELLNHPDVNVNITNTDHNTPLHYFCQHWQVPDIDEDERPFKLFIQKGADVNARNEPGETPIFKAINNNFIRGLLMKELIANNADLNIRTNQNGDTILHYAVYFGRTDLIKLILTAAPKLEIKNNNGQTAYEVACQYKNDTAKSIKVHKDLFDWLDENGLQEFKSVFVKNEITKSLLVDMDEVHLEDMGITSVGKRLQIIKACKRLNKKELDPTAALGADDKPALTDGQASKLAEDLGSSSGFVNIEGGQLEYVKKLGTGAAGDVYKGLFQGNKTVAIKVLKEVAPGKEIEDFKKEYRVLSAIRHPNIVLFIGVSFVPRLCMVMEYCARGSLYHVMRDDGVEFTWARVVDFANQMTKGVIALHQNTPQIMHRDLKSLNILVSKDWIIKVADFGLARFDDASQLQTLHQMRGTFAYLGPEIYHSKKFTPKTDVYALGVIFWEMVTRCVTGVYTQPYSEYNIQFDFQIIIQSAKEDKRPTISDYCHKRFRDLIKVLWDPNPDVRPDAPGLLEQLKDVGKEFQANKGEWEKMRNEGIQEQLRIKARGKK
mmetsp:Transcript_4738/g.5133  ORF Transcript_4738/g.5133 Transcript_4738/m.5133 type:complete len:757 (+) Transcript_4738:39-2309(+)